MTEVPEEPEEPEIPEIPELPRPEPKIKTKARDAESGTHIAEADSEVTIIDEVSYENLEEGSSYVIEGVLMDKENEEPIRDDDGDSIRGITEFIAGESGSVEVEFDLNAEKLAGRSTVVYEYLKKDGEIITSHTDIKSSSQTVKFKKKPGRSSPNTGDGTGINLLWYLLVITVSFGGLLLTAKNRNDRLN